MKRNSVLKVLNPILALLALNQVVTALLNESLSGGVFEVLHERAGLVLGAVIAAHVILNWNWIKASYFRKPASARGR